MTIGHIEFLPTVQRIHHGAGVLVGALRDEAARLGAGCPFVLLARALQGTAVESRLREALPNGVFHSAPFEHVPPGAVLEAAAAAADCGADLVIAVGGGSALDTAKGLRYVLAASIRSPDALLPAMRASQAPGAPLLPQLSLPTTLSGAEYTRSFSATDRALQEKQSLTLNGLASTAIIYDPQLTAFTPEALWLGSGLVALDHALEVYVCAAPHPVADALKERAARTLWAKLPATRGSDSAPLRLDCQLAAWMVDHSPLRTRAAGAAGTPWSHLLAYDLAALTGLSYAHTAALTLPNALRELAREPACAARIRCLERVLGVYAPLADAVETWTRQLGLPTSAAAIGLDAATLTRVAAAAARRGGVDAAACARVLGLDE